MYLPDDLFDTVSGLSNLQMLDLNYGSNVTKRNIGVLCGGGMEQLTILRMDGTDVPDAALVHIPKLPSLVQLHLASCWKVRTFKRSFALPHLLEKALETCIPIGQPRKGSDKSGEI